MDDFFKTKVGFTIGLLAAVFAIKPIIEANSSLGFLIFGLKITIEYAYLFLTFCLSLAVYFISLQFASAKHVSLLDKISNTCYSVALATPPVFIAFWLTTSVLEFVGGYLVQIPDIWLNILAGVLSGVFGNVIFGFFAKSIRQKSDAADQDRERKVDIELLTKAQELFKLGMYDMSVLESSKVVESIVHRLLTLRGIPVHRETFLEMIRLSEHNGILTKKESELLHEIRKKRNASVHSIEAVDKASAERILFLSRDLISKLDITSNLTAYQWLEKNRENVLLAFKSGDSKKSKEPIRKLMVAWENRDGAVWLELAEFFEVALQNSPHLIIESFGNDKSLLNSWLESINVQLFTDFIGGEKSKLLKSKELILKSIETYVSRCTNAEHKAVAYRIMKVVQESTIDEVD
ncbi:MAG: hypothetical protein JKX76_10115 [Colwellia sp.]|nr:hypothetical protein [Colwellia sp.]